MRNNGGINKVIRVLVDAAKDKRVQLCLIILITWLAYSNILHNDFVMDDSTFLFRWPAASSFDINELIQGSLPGQHSGGYRPIRSIIFAGSYNLFGTNPVGYHIQSIFIHLLCTILVYLIVRQLTKKSLLAFMTSLLFGVHPIHTEAITWITASIDMIGMIFFLTAFYFYLLYRELSEEEEGTLKHKKNKSTIYYLLSLTAATIAFFSYELTLTLPLILIFFDFCFWSSHRRNILRSCKAYIPYFLSVGSYFIIRFLILKIPNRDITYFAGSAYHTFLTVIKAVFRYIYVSVFPVHLSYNHMLPGGILTMHRWELQTENILAQSIFDINILVPLLIIATFILAAVFYRQRYPLFSFFTGWFFISLLPVLHFIPSQVILKERYAYVACLTICFLISSLIYRLYNLKYRNYQKQIKIAASLLFVCFLLFYGYQTHERNKDWKNERTIMLKEFQNAPKSVFVNYRLGKVFISEGNYVKAVKHLSFTTLRNPLLPHPYHCLNELNPSEENVSRFVDSLNQGNNPMMREYILGSIYLQRNLSRQAIKHLIRTLNFNRQNEYLHYTLGNAYSRTGDHQKAAQQWEEMRRREQHRLTSVTFDKIVIQEKEINMLCGLTKCSLLRK